MDEAKKPKGKDPKEPLGAPGGLYPGAKQAQKGNKGKEKPKGKGKK
jgi:hypothetical protein